MAPSITPTVGELLRESAAFYGARPALLEKTADGYEEISYVGLLAEAEALAAALAARLAPDTRVLIVGKNSYDLLLAYFAAALCASVPVPADESLSPTELTALAEDCGTTAVLYADARAEAVAVLPMQIALPFSAFPSLILEGNALIDSEGYLSPTVDPDATATILASGKSGRVALSHRLIGEMLMKHSRTQRISERDRFFTVLPAAHVLCMLPCVLFPLSCGAAVAFGEGMHTLLADMRQVAPTQMVTVPFLAEEMLKKYRQTVSENSIEAVLRRTAARTPTAAGRIVREHLPDTLRHLFGGKLCRILTVGAPLEDALHEEWRRIGVMTVQSDGFLRLLNGEASGASDEEADATHRTEAEFLLCQHPLVREAAVIRVPVEGETEAIAVLMSEADEAEMTRWLQAVNDALPDREQVALFTLRSTPLPRCADGTVDREAVARELA